MSLRTGTSALARAPHARQGIACAILALGLCAGTAAAQDAGVLRGRIVDPAGAPLPGAVVTLLSPSHPQIKGSGAVSNARGEYRVVGLPPAADYEVTCSLPGFASVIMRPVRVTAGGSAVADFTLFASIVDTVRVESTGSVVDTEQVVTSTSINREYLGDLPILGRNYSDVLTLAPGVTDTDGDGNPNVKGAREVDFQLRISGVQVNDPLSGERALDFNIEAIEEIQVLTGAMSAEHSSQGGVGVVSTRSGGNEFEGSFKVFYQTRALDGDGGNNNDFDGRRLDLPSFRTLRPFLTAGGALRRDRLWYFAALEYIDEQEPVSFGAAARLRSREGQRDFAKLTWQINPRTKTSLEIYYEPTDTAGNNIAPTIAEESDALLDSAGRILTLRGTTVFSPTVLLDSTAGFYALDDEVYPVEEPSLSLQDDLAAYSEHGYSPDRTMEAFILRNQFSVNPFDEHYLFDLESGRVSGPFFVSSSQDSRQFTLREDLSWYVDDLAGSHTLKGGLEWQQQRYDERVLLRPQAFSRPLRGGATGVSMLGPVPAGAVPTAAERANLALYLQDSWKPIANLTLSFGVRLDREIVSAAGRSLFDPHTEVAEYNRLARLFYATTKAAGNDPNASGQVVLGDGHNFDINPATDTFYCDLDGDGTCDGLTSPLTVDDPRVPLNSDLAVLRSVFSRHDLDCARIPGWNAEPSLRTSSGRECFGTGQTGNLREGHDLVADDIDLGNSNLAPRLSLSWDPFADGRTKLYATYGRFYGSLFLGTVVSERRPAYQSFRLELPRGDVLLRSPSEGGIDAYQVSRDLRTPFTDEITLGLERELAPELAIKVVYTSRRGRDQLQDIDLNHVTVDRLGRPGGGPDGLFDDCLNAFEPSGQACNPDGVPDLEPLNPNFNQIFRIGNFNRSDYSSLELVLSKRLHRNWQFEASYTWSEARGNAESFLSFLGDDPSQVVLEEGFQEFDQRHVFKFNAVAQLPREVSVGGTILYESGLPFSLVVRDAVADSQGNTTFRTIFPTAQRNDLRNRAVWTFSASVKKGLKIGRVKGVASFDVFDMLNTDELRIFSLNRRAEHSLQISDPVDAAERGFGRRFQAGIALHF